MRSDGSASAKPARESEDKSVCGVVMPISEHDGCSEAHWTEVKEIIFEAIEVSDFEPHLVSEADDAGVIHKRIIQNLYQNPIVVCDVSGKNPNVMFELGLRLAFDKPTIIVKDDKTTYSFDTGSIEHLEYPRDLRFPKVVVFKEELAEKIHGTHEKAVKDPDYTTFLKHFGAFVLPRLETRELPRDEYILNELQSLRKEVMDVVAQRKATTPPPQAPKKTLCLQTLPSEAIEAILTEVRKIENMGDLKVVKPSNGHTHVPLGSVDLPLRQAALAAARRVSPKARLI
jgi:hypothetical protein